MRGRSAPLPCSTTFVYSFSTIAWPGIHPFRAASRRCRRPRQQFIAVPPCKQAAPFSSRQGSKDYREEEGVEQRE